MKSLTPRVLALPMAVAVLMAAGAAQAHVCGGAASEAGRAFRGPVLDVIDGERFCVALGPEPSRWVALRLADAPALPPRLTAAAH